MDRKIIKIIIIIAVTALLAGSIGLILFKTLSPKATIGHITSEQAYYLKEIHPNAFNGVNIDSNSYFKINADYQTGELYLVGLPGDAKIQFIITNYQEGKSKTLINIEYLYQNKLRHMQAESTKTEIRFRHTLTYRVDITREHPDDTQYLEYASTVLVFSKEVA